MVKTDIPAEIRAYKSKLIFGLSLRQLIAIAGAVVVGVAIGVLSRGKIPDDILIWLVILSVVPFAGWGFLRIQEMPFEELVRTVIRFCRSPRVRVYEDTETNLFVQLHEEMIEEQVIEERLESGEYERTEG